MTFMGWVGAIAAGWFTASILFGVVWALVGRRIFRKPPPPSSHLVLKTELTPEEAAADLIAQLKRRMRQSGGF